jgi:hypothetical protein
MTALKRSWIRSRASSQLIGSKSLPVTVARRRIGSRMRSAPCTCAGKLFTTLAQSLPRV